MCHLAYLRLTDEDPPPEWPELLLPEKELLRPIELLLLTEEDLLTDELLLLLKFAEELFLLKKVPDEPFTVADPLPYEEDGVPEPLYEDALLL